MSSSLPKIAIVGRPNVGKSTLFNRLVGRKQAIVDDIPGVTRDRQYGVSEWGGRYFEVIDTGGFTPEASRESLEKAVMDQALLAIEEADGVIFIVDGRFGLTPAEETLGNLLRRQSKPVLLAVNKIDRAELEGLVGEFFRLGLKTTLAISAETSRGISDLLDQLLPILQAAPENLPEASDLKIAIVGRPNVGKSTLLNALLGEERAVVHPSSGTTRDPLNIRMERGTRIFEFVDTAGIRRKAKTEGKLEKVSVIKALKSLDKAHCALVVVDAYEGLTTHDAKILQESYEKGKGAILVLNKWDLVPSGTTLVEFKESIFRRYKRFEYVPILAISARYGRGIKKLYQLLDQVFENYMRRIGTGELNRVFQKAIELTPPPTESGFHVGLYYITQSGWGPPTFVLFSNRPKLVKENYLRYLERVFRKNFQFKGAPIRWVMRQKK